MLNMIFDFIKKLDPKWAIAFLIALATITTVAYLIYARRKAEELNKKLERKLALAESDKLQALSEVESKRSKEFKTEADKLTLEISKLKEHIQNLKRKSEERRRRLTAITSWEGLGI